MATLGKIRSKGPLLVIIVGIALLSFIAQAAFEGLKGSRTANVGEIYGDNISATDFQSAVEEYENVLKFTGQLANPSEEQSAQIKNQVWNTIVTNRIVEHEAGKLGLSVSDAEVANVLTEGTNTMLRQTPFVNQQTGQFDKDQLQKFLSEYATLDRTQLPVEYQEQYATLYNYWLYVEKTLRQQILAEKYQALLSNSILTNQLELDNSFQARTQTADFLVAAIPYSSIADDKVQLTDADLKAIYDKKKELFYQNTETRDVKYIDVQVKASPADRAAIESSVKEAEAALTAGSDYKDILHNADSETDYIDLYLTSESFTSDVAAKIETAAQGEVVPTFFSAQDNTFNTLKVLSTTREADSVKFRQIPVQRATDEETQQLTDSILTALRSGASFDTLATRYGGNAEGQWLTTQSYASALTSAQVLDATSEKLFATIFSAAAGAIETIDLPAGKLIVQVQEKQASALKYKVALVKKTLTFSKETYNQAYNGLSKFLSENNTLEQFAANAEKNGFRVQELPNLSSAAYFIGGVKGTHDALRWVFQADEQQISALYECGDNDHLLVVALTGITEKGYTPFAKVKESLHTEALRDKKAAQILADIEKVKPTTFTQTAAIAGVITDSLVQVSFANPVYVAASTSSESALSAYAAIAKAGKLTAPIKGNGGVYLLQLIQQNKSAETFNAISEKQRLQNTRNQALGNFMGDLYLQAKAQDKRYLYF
jgi:peptidyl-prolyl cis-trans isomerase D